MVIASLVKNKILIFYRTRTQSNFSLPAYWQAQKIPPLWVGKTKSIGLLDYLYICL